MTSLSGTTPSRIRPGVAITTTPAAYGGLEKVTSELTRGLRRRGREVLLVVVLEPHTEEPSWVRALHEEVEVIVVRVAARDYVGEYRTIQDLLKARNIAIVHTHGYRADLVHGLAARRLGKRTVSTVHGFTGKGWRGRLYERLQFRALRSFDAVVAVSRPLADELASSGITKSRIHLIANGMPVARRAVPDRGPARVALGVPETGTVIGWVGRVSAEKGPDVVLKALEALPPDITLCLVGDGPELGNVRALASALHLQSRVFSPGAVMGASELFRAFDLLVLSSRTEGTPMVLLEAAVAGVPIVSTSVGGVPDLLGTDGGWLVPPENPSALSTAIASAIADPAEAMRRARNLLARLEARTAADDWIARYDALYALLSVAEASAPPQTLPPAPPPQASGEGDRRSSPTTS